MIRKVLVVVVVGLLLAADSKDKKDEDKLQGTWVLESEERDGAKQDIGVKTPRVTFTNAGQGKVEDRKSGMSVEITYQLDAAKDPKHIDVTVNDKKVKGIYKIDGDTLTVCVGADDSDERPTAFATQAGDQRKLLILKREKK
jgi:uncharacterized protein (TIGR03067 family)